MAQGDVGSAKNVINPDPATVEGGVVNSTNGLLSARYLQDKCGTGSQESEISVFANGHSVKVYEEDNVLYISTINGNDVFGFTAKDSDEKFYAVRLYGGSYEANVAKTEITLFSGAIRNIYGGGRSDDPEQPANVSGMARINVDAGSFSLICGGGRYYARTNATYICIGTKDNPYAGTSNYIMAGGMDQGLTTNKDNKYNSSLTTNVNAVNTVTMDIHGGTFSVIGAGGGNGYTHTGTSTVNLTNVTVNKFYGVYSNGIADDVTVTMTGGSINQEFASINRGKLVNGSFTTTNTTFGNDVKAYIGATSGWANSDTNGDPAPVVTGKLFYSLAGLQEIYLGEGLADATFEVHHSKVKVAKFYRGSQLPEGNRYLNAFTINTNGRWTANAGMTFGTGDDTAALTNNGNLSVGPVDANHINDLYALFEAGVNGLVLEGKPDAPYILSKQLVIKKPMTLYGMGAILKADPSGDWPQKKDDNTKYDNPKCNLISIEAGQDAEVRLEKINVMNSKAAGINVQTARKVTLTNVTSKENATAGLLVHAPVEASGFQTAYNAWGGVNIDKGNNGSDKYDYNPSFTFNESCSFAEPKQIWSELAEKEATAIVTLPADNTTWRAIKGRDEKNTKDIWFWTNVKLTQESVTSFFMDKAVSGNYKLVYANGNPIIIEQGTTADEVVISVDNTDESIALNASDNIIVFGGAKDANVSSTNITMKGGKIAKLIGGCYYGNVENVTLNISGGEISEHLIAGGYGPANVQSTVTNKSANVTTKSTVTITDTGQSHTKIGYTVTTGLGYSKVKEIYTSISNATLGWVIGGFAPVGIGQTIDTDFDNNVNTVENASLIIKHSTINNGVCLGGGFSYSYAKNVNAIFDNTRFNGGLYGSGFNGRADNVTAEIKGCVFYNKSGDYRTIAALVRGKIGTVSMTFDEQCIFNLNAADESPYELYLGADRDNNSATAPYAEQATFEFKGSSLPLVKVSKGMHNVTVTGAPVVMGKFEWNITGTDYTSEFEIPENNTWTFNNGLSITNEVTSFTNNGTLIVKGVDSEADLKALVTSKANEITTTLAAEKVPAAFSEMAELPTNMVIYAADKAVYMTESEATTVASTTGKATAYLVKTNSGYELNNVSAPTIPPVIEDANKPSIVGEPEAGKTLSAYALKGGIATVGDVQVAGSFTWANPDAILAAGENEYDVVFTPVDLTLYSTVKTSIKIKAVQYYTVTVGTCENGKVIIENASTANKYQAGTTLNVRAEADAHYKLKNWGEGITGTNNTITYTVAEDKELTATFEAITHEVTVSSVTGGTLSVMNNGTTISYPVSVPEGTILTVVATPANANELESLNYQIGNTTYPIRNGQVEVSAAMTISASFKDKANYLLKLATGVANGKILLFDEQGNAINMGTAVATGKKITAVAVPDKGYTASAITVNGVALDNPYYEVGTSDVEFSATFTRAIYSITTDAGANISLSKVSGSGTAANSCHYGDVYTATATPAAGNKLISLLVNGKEMANGGQFTVTGDMTVKVNEVALTTIQIDDTKQTYVYDGEAKKFAIRSVPMGLTGFTVTYQNGSTTYTEAPTNAGTYKVIIARDADESFAAFNQTIEGGLVIERAELKGIGAPTWDHESNQWTGSSLGTWEEGSAITEDKIYKVKFHPTDPNFKDIEFEGIKSNDGLTVVSMPSSGLRSSTLRAETEASLSITATNGAVSLWNGTEKITSTSSTVYVGQTLTVKGLPDADYSSNATWTINNGTSTTATGTSTKITLGLGENTITVQFPEKAIPSLPSASNTTTAYSGSVILPTITNSTGLNGWTYVIKAGGVVVDHPTDADTYEVYASRSEDERYKAVENQLIGSYTISKQTITDVSITSASPILKGQTLAQSTLTGTAPVAGTFAWASPTTVATGTTEDATESQEYAVIFTPNDTKNYEVESSVSLKQKVTFYTGSATATARVITFVPAANGTFVVKVNGVAVETGAQVSAGDQVVVETTPNSGYSASVSYTGITNGVVDASGNVAVTVTFTQNSAPVTPGGGGTVDPDPVIPTVSNPVVAERTATTAAITWEKVSGATSYKLFLYAKKTDSTPLKTYEFDKDGKLKATTISFTLTGLEEGKSYYIETAAYNALGTLLVKKSVELSATPTGIEAISEGSQLYTVKGAIVVAPAEPLRVAIYSVTGQTLFNDEVSYLTQVPAKAGIYVVVIQKGKERITEKVFVK